MTVDDGRAGLGVGLRYMPEEFPKAIRANRPSPGVYLLLWKDSGHGRLAFNRYSEEVSWDEGEGVYSDGTGAAKTSEYLIHFFDAVRPGSITNPAPVQNANVNTQYIPRFDCPADIHVCSMNNTIVE